MSRRMQFILGSLVLLFGLLLLLENLLDISFWQFCWPIGLILLGIALLLGPRLRLFGSNTNVRFFGGVNRKAAWRAANEEIWMFVGDIHLDLTTVELPEGETTLRIIGFVGDIDLVATPETPLSIAANGFLTSGKIFGRKEDTFLSTQRFTNEGYPEASSRLNVETLFFVNDLSVKQG